MPSGIYIRTEEYKQRLRDRLKTLVRHVGPIHSEDQKAKWSKMRRGQKRSLEAIVKSRISNTGKKLSEETKRKIGEANRLSLRGNTPWNKGLKGFMAGEKHYNWKGGAGTERHRLMQQLDYKNWRSAVFERDSYTCQSCGQTGTYLEADHIKPWALYPELRYAIDNGRTLCKPCHMKTDTYAGNFRKGAN